MPTVAVPYIKYTADDFYSQLLETCKQNIPVKQKYKMLRGVFYRVVEQRLAHCELNFAGLFAKVDYILKETQVPHGTARQIHASRTFMFPEHNRKIESTDEELITLFPHDLKSTALLISYATAATAIGQSAAASIPSELKQHFPDTERINRWGTFDADTTRVIVERWDDEHIWATSEESGDNIVVCYGHANTNLTRGGTGDWSYLADILSKGSQLNLVRVRTIDGILHPELIIFEPDYLINITTIASCFETYAESPLVNLINKLKPAANTLPIHLGNLAGQYLDDAIHGRDIPFAEGIRSFFHANALNMVACPELSVAQKAQEFYANAQQQKKNIQHFINDVLPSSISGYNNTDVVLEPSFYSETLGIQGRMDFLLEKNGETVIIEQKAGKGAFVPFSAPGFNPNRPEAQLKHTIQVLLYRSLMVYEFHRYADQLRHIMLMYSRYSDGLISIAQMPGLMLRAIRMRNLLAHDEISYASNGLDILPSLTPDSLNLNGSTGKLWEQYTRPELERLLSPIRQASVLERAYYLRFMQFLHKEQLLAKIGNKTKENSGFASSWHDTLEAKHLAGNIYDQLTISRFICNGSNVSGLRLKFAVEQSTDTSNFRVGDIIVLYPYREGAIPAICQQMVNRATIVAITPEEIEVTLRNTQTDKQVFSFSEPTFWAIEHDLMEASADSLYRAMHSFLCASPERRGMLMNQRQPTVDESIHPIGDYGSFNTLVTHASQAREFFIIIGPPGTGKTSHGLVNLLNEELAHADGSVLLLSYTNRAVDEICSKLVNQGTDFIRIGSQHSCSPLYRDYLLSNRVSSCSKGSDVSRLLQSVRVFCGTTAAINSSMSLFSIRSFSLAIIDEASQILEPHIIGILSAHASDGSDAIRRFILIGDHKQLPAVVQQTPEESAITDTILLSAGITDCRLSLFERMLSRFRTAPDTYDPRYVYMLTKQGRMHHDIAEFPNSEFYGGKLDIVPLEHQLAPLTPDTNGSSLLQAITSRRVTFFPSRCPAESSSDKTNSNEAQLIADIVIEIYRHTASSFDGNQTIGIIVPYRNQIATIRGAIAEAAKKISADAMPNAAEHLQNIAIDTVERFQGSQRDYIIYGFTIQHAYQLNFLASTSFVEDGKIIDRKLNVAMTRARLHLIIIGNPELLSLNPTYKKLLAYS